MLGSQTGYFGPGKEALPTLERQTLGRPISVSVAGGGVVRQVEASCPLSLPARQPGGALWVRGPPLPNKLFSRRAAERKGQADALLVWWPVSKYPWAPANLLRIRAANEINNVTNVHVQLQFWSILLETTLVENFRISTCRKTCSK